MLQSEKRITGRVQCSAGYFCIYNYLECFFSAAVKYRTFRIMFFRIFVRRIPLRILFGEQIIIIALGGLDFLYCHVYFYAILCYNR